MDGSNKNISNELQPIRGFGPEWTEQRNIWMCSWAEYTWDKAYIYDDDGFHVSSGLMITTSFVYPSNNCLFHRPGCVILVSYYLQAKQAAELAFKDNKQLLVSSIFLLNTLPFELLQFVMQKQFFVIGDWVSHCWTWICTRSLAFVPIIFMSAFQMHLEMARVNLKFSTGDGEGGIEMTESVQLIREFCDRFIKPEKATRTRIVC